MEKNGWAFPCLDIVSVARFLSVCLTDTVWLQSEWQPHTVFQPAVWLGSLHNYIKAWFTAQPQHTSYKYNCTSSPFLLSHTSCPCCYSRMAEEAPNQSPHADLSLPPTITRYWLVWVDFKRCCSIFTGGRSIAKITLFLKGSSWSSVVRLFKVVWEWLQKCHEFVSHGENTWRLVDANGQVKLSHRAETKRFWSLCPAQHQQSKKK